MGQRKGAYTGQDSDIIKLLPQFRLKPEWSGLSLASSPGVKPHAGL